VRTLQALRETGFRCRCTARVAAAADMMRTTFLAVFFENVGPFSRFKMTAALDRSTLPRW
jgi:hypothetical protein